VLLFINAIVLVVEEYEILAGNEASLSLDQRSWAQPVSYTFTSLFTLELAVKLLALGITDYTSSTSNLFDFFVLASIVVTQFLAEVLPGHQEQIVRYILAIRLGRLGRFLAHNKEISLIVATFFRMLPAAAKLLQVLFVAMFCFSALGGQLFGGLINYGPQYGLLNVTDFGQANYYANNFNDLASGMVVCFELLVVNNWFIIADGFTAVASPKPLVRLFFVVVYIFGVLVCLNIVLAFALDSFNEARATMNDASATEASDDAAEGTADGSLDTDGRDHSASISKAQNAFRAVVPFHLPNAGSVGRLLTRAAARSPTGSPTAGARAKINDAQQGADGGGSSWDVRPVEAA